MRVGTFKVWRDCLTVTPGTRSARKGVMVLLTISRTVGHFVSKVWTFFFSSPSANEVILVIFLSFFVFFIIGNGRSMATALNAIKLVGRKRVSERGSRT